MISAAAALTRALTTAPINEHGGQSAPHDDDRRRDASVCGLPQNGFVRQLLTCSDAAGRCSQLQRIIHRLIVSSRPAVPENALFHTEHPGVQFRGRRILVHGKSGGGQQPAPVSGFIQLNFYFHRARTLVRCCCCLASIELELPLPACFALIVRLCGTEATAARFEWPNSTAWSAVMGEGKWAIKPSWSANRAYHGTTPRTAEARGKMAWDWAAPLYVHLGQSGTEL